MGENAYRKISMEFFAFLLQLLMNLRLEDGHMYAFAVLKGTQVLYYGRECL